MENKSNKRTAIVLLLIGTVFWGMTFVFIKEAVSTLGVYNFLFYRFLIAALSLMIVFYKRLPNIEMNTIYKGVLLSLPLSLGFISQTIGIKYTSASNAGFITGLSVVIVPILLSLASRSLPKQGTVIAVLLSAVGLAFITLSGSLSLNMGDLWILICAFAFAVYMIMVSKESGKHDSVLLTLVQLVCVAVFSFILSLSKEGLSVPMHYDEWQGIIFCSLFATTFMYTVQNHYQQFLSVTSTAIIFSLEPLFAAITAFIVLNEGITVKTIIGGSLLIGGMIASELLQDKKLIVLRRRNK
jgi:drug/metabolite transporter (DMT)-like permease